MPRLLITSGTGSGREIDLKPGDTTVGRGEANDITISDSSVSTRHCRIQVNGAEIRIEDLGSTNGTFIDGRQISTATLLPGQTLRLGQVDLILSPEVAIATPATVQSRAPVPVAVAVRPSAAVPAPPQIVARPNRSMVIEGAAGVAQGTPCKHHPKAPARFACPQCGHAFCELCVTMRQGNGAQQRLCRHCGVECYSLQVQFRPTVAKTFFQLLPDAFLYPFRGSGPFLLVAGAILLVLLRAGAALFQYGSLRLIILGVLLELVLSGYLYAYMQAIVQSSAAEDPEMPQLPGIGNMWDDVVRPFFQFLGMLLICFGPWIAVDIAGAVSPFPGHRIASLAAMILGCVYFPMAFLAVSVLDSVVAANPLLVASSITRVAKEYAVTCVLSLGILALRELGNIMVASIFPPVAETYSVRQLLLSFALRSAWAVIGFFLLVVTARLLGTLYVTNKEDLAWGAQGKHG